MSAVRTAGDLRKLAGQFSEAFNGGAEYTIEQMMADALVYAWVHIAEECPDEYAVCHLVDSGLAVLRLATRGDLRYAEDALGDGRYWAARCIDKTKLAEAGQ